MRKLLGATAIVAIVLSVGFGSAVAAGLVTSGQIENFTIRARDMSSGSVNTRVIDDGTIQKEDLDANLEGQLLFGTVPSGRA